MNVLGVIPARYASTRFPGKPLIDIQGKSMIHRVYDQAMNAESLGQVVVATDDHRIYDHVKEFGGKVIMTSPTHQNGTSRCNEVLEILRLSQNTKSIDVIVNIQGDEPFIDPTQINKVVSLFDKPLVEIGTLVRKIEKEEDLFNPNVVKAVLGSENRALYFSRQAVPYLRDIPQKEWIEKGTFYKHIGIYGYRSDILTRIVSLAPGKIEMVENLEQLRWLENGISIFGELTDFEGVAIDTPEDLLKLTNRD